MNRFKRLSLALGLAALSALSQAASVSASYSLIAGNTWQASFSFSNDIGDLAAPGLTVYFDAALYDNLASPVAPTGWDPIVIQPNGLSDGYFDAYAYNTADELQPGQALGGFSVQFNYLGTGAPGTLSYEFYRLDGAFDFVSLQTGTTTTVPSTQPLPEPGTLALGAAALAGLLAGTRRKATPAQNCEEVLA
jgi:hypothetical protein